MVMISSDLTQPPGLEPLRADLDELKWEVISISTMMIDDDDEQKHFNNYHYDDDEKSFD